MRVYSDDQDIQQLVELHRSVEQVRDTIEYNVRAFALRRAIILYRALLRRWHTCSDPAFQARSLAYQRCVIRSVFKSRIYDHDVLWGPLFAQMKPRVWKFYSHISDDDAVWDTIYPPASEQVTEIGEVLPHGLPEGETYSAVPKKLLRNT